MFAQPFAFRFAQAQPAQSPRLDHGAVTSGFFMKNQHKKRAPVDDAYLLKLLKIKSRHRATLPQSNMQYHRR
jgi:hypothetical protein